MLEKRDTRFHPLGLIVSLTLIGLATLLSFVWERDLGPPGVVILFFLTVVLSSYWYGLYASLLASVLAVASLNYFFIEPRHTFFVATTENWVSLAGLLVVSLLVSSLNFRLNQAKSVAEQTRLHSDLARELLEALTSQDTRERILSVGAERAAKILGTDVMLLKRVAHRFKTLHSQGSEFSFEPKVLQFVGDHGSIAGPDTGSHESLNYWVVPLEPPSTEATVLLVKVPYGSGIRKLSDQLALLRLTRLIAQQISLALAQERSRRNAMDAIKERDEVTRRNQLLASIAHDMRTPLSTIVSSAHILTEAATDHRGRALLATIIDEATQMGRVTENALSMVRLQWGRRLISADWQSIEEIIGVVVSRYRNRVGQLPAVATLVDSNLPLVWVDGPLFSQLLDNLLQNAVRHSESNEPIDISARKIQDLIEIKVMDRGVGFSNEVLVAFEAMKGDSSPSTDSTPLGLGLAICNAIAGAHGAEIRLSNATAAQSGAATGGIASVLLPVNAILKVNP